ncbi:MAG: hypothetical protein V3W28_01650 [Thermoplasmata archaeon]
MSWSCTHCPWTYDGDDIGPGVMHETLNPAHRVDPDLETVTRWLEVV